LANDWKIEPLGPQHDRAAFSSGSAALDQYLKTQAGQAVAKNLAAVFILTPDGKTILGYFTLSAFSVNFSEIPEQLAKKLTKMGEVPATLLGRLARSLDEKGKGIGEILLVDALKKALLNSATVASWAVVVDAKDDNASAFYKRFGFVEFPNTPKRLFLPMQSIEELFADETANAKTSSPSVDSPEIPRDAAPRS
jgi:predicted GNAT family N-acyltransferase